MTPQPLTLDSLFDALAEGWRVANATRGASIAYTAIFVVAGAAIIGSLLARGWTPFVIAAAGAFMLVGPVILAGYFGIARACEAGQGVGLAAVAAGFGGASRALWALALVCGLLFMIFVTDAAILYAYMIGDVPVWLGELLPAAAPASCCGRRYRGRWSPSCSSLCRPSPCPCCASGGPAWSRRW